MTLDRKYKYKGSFFFPRKLTNDLLNGFITFDQYALLTVYVGLADWDYKHADFSVCKFTNKTLGKLINRLNKNKIGFNKRILEIKNYIEIIHLSGNNELVKIKNPELYFNVRKPSKNDSISRNQDTYKI